MKNNLRIIQLALVLCFALWAGTLFSSPVVINDRETQLGHIGEHCEYLEDSSGLLEFRDILSQKFSSKFKKIESENPNFSFTDSAYWFRFSLRDERKEKNTDPIVAVYNWPYVNSIEAYVPRVDGTYRIVKTGTDFRNTTRDISSRLFVFNLGNPEKNRVNMVYFRCKTGGIMIFPMKISTHERLSRITEGKSMALGIFFGMLMVIILYNLTMRAAMRDRDFIYISLFIFSQLIAYLLLEGVIPWFYEFPIEYLNKVMMFLGSLSAIAVLQFSAHMLNLKREHPLFQKIFHGGSLFYIFSGLAAFLLPVFHGWGLFFIVVLFFNILILSLAALKVREGSSQGLNLFLFMVLYFSGAAVNNMLRFNLVPPNAFTVNVKYFSIIAAVIVLTYGITMRIRRSEQEKLITQKRSIESFERAERLRHEFIFNATRELRRPSIQ